MQFRKGFVYHLFNQGNNRRIIFFNKDHYMFFIKKVQTYILPYADILAWCLMPNHFHLMIVVKETELAIEELKKESSHLMTSSHRVTETQKNRSLNDSIAIMLRSYTRALNKQKGFSGSLFRSRTKAVCLNCPDGITPSWFVVNGATQINITDPDTSYPGVCFDYIHQNPVMAGLVERSQDWEYSSAAVYLENKEPTLANTLYAKEFIPGVESSDDFKSADDY